jgi:hypothetical protein
MLAETVDGQTPTIRCTMRLGRSRCRTEDDAVIIKIFPGIDLPNQG